MELIWTEEQTNKLWDDDELASLIRGCKEVVVEVLNTRKHLTVFPKQIKFESWVIDLSQDMTGPLLKVVDLVPYVKPEA